MYFWSFCFDVCFSHSPCRKPNQASLGIVADADSRAGFIDFDSVPKVPFSRPSQPNPLLPICEEEYLPTFTINLSQV